MNAAVANGNRKLADGQHARSDAIVSLGASRVSS
jgi:hypothetical protein